MQTKTLAAALLAAITLSMAGAGFAQSQTRAAGSDTAAASKPAGERPRAHGVRGHHRMGNPVDALARLDTDNDGRISRADLAFGGVAAKPWRDGDAEAVLLGREPSDALFAQAADILLKPARAFGDHAFKIPLLRRTLMATLRDATGLEATA